MPTQTQTNVIYKDRLFKAIFGRQENKNWLLSLYNALNGSDYTNPDDLELTCEFIKEQSKRTIKSACIRF